MVEVRRRPIVPRPLGCGTNAGGLGGSGEALVERVVRRRRRRGCGIPIGGVVCWGCWCYGVCLVLVVNSRRQDGLFN